MKLSELASGEWIVIDTNILVYANQQKSAEAAGLLRRCAVRDVNGVVPMPMVAELVHALMLIEARENGWIDKPNPARCLSEHPERVRRLSRYDRQVREFIGMGLRMEPALAADVIEALSIQREDGLLTNDALLLAIARRLNCTAIASADSAFQGVDGFILYEPGDLDR
jgi:predicted nucleic acid-binding protein